MDSIFAQMLKKYDINNINDQKNPVFVRPFIKDTQSLKLWSADFFKQITEQSLL